MTEFKPPASVRHVLEGKEALTPEEVEQLELDGLSAPRATEPPVTGKYFGPNPTGTERESGTQIEYENRGPLKAGGAGHRVLSEFATGERLSAYEASFRASGDYHAMRREATRLAVSGFVRKDGEVPNPAPRGRKHVDAYRITLDGEAELRRLGGRP